MERLGVFLLPLDGMLVHRRSLLRNLLGFYNNSPGPIYPPGWREALAVTVKCLAQEHNTVIQPRLEPGPLDPGTSALTMRPPPLKILSNYIHRNTPAILREFSNITARSKSLIVFALARFPPIQTVKFLANSLGVFS